MISKSKPLKGRETNKMNKFREQKIPQNGLSTPKFFMSPKDPKYNKAPVHVISFKKKFNLSFANSSEGSDIDNRTDKVQEVSSSFNFKAMHPSAR